MRTLKFATPKTYQNFYGSKAVLPVNQEKLEIRVSLGKSSLEDMPENRFILDALNIPYSVS